MRALASICLAAALAASLSGLTGCAEKNAPPPAVTVAPPTPAPAQAATALKTNAAGLALIKESEGLRLDAYQDGGQWYIGYGHAIAPKAGTRITQAEAEQFLKDDLGVCEKAIRDAVKVPVTANEFGAMASLCYSIGWQRYAASSVVQRLNANDRKGAADAFLMWTKITQNGKRVVLPRLEARREKEKALFLKAEGAGPTT